MRIFGGFAAAWKDGLWYRRPLCIIKPSMDAALEAAQQAAYTSYPLDRGYHNISYDVVECETHRPVEVPHD